MRRHTNFPLGCRVAPKASSHPSSHLAFILLPYQVSPANSILSNLASISQLSVPQSQWERFIPPALSRCLREVRNDYPAKEILNYDEHEESDVATIVWAFCGVNRLIYDIKASDLIHSISLFAQWPCLSSPVRWLWRDPRELSKDHSSTCHLISNPPTVERRSKLTFGSETVRLSPPSGIYELLLHTSCTWSIKPDLSYLNRLAWNIILFIE